MTSAGDDDSGTTMQTDNTSPAKTAGTTNRTTESTQTTDDGASPPLTRMRTNRLTLAATLFSFGVLFVSRVIAYPSVLRGESIISQLNDPYYFRYHMSKLLDQASGPLDFSVLSDTDQAFNTSHEGTHFINWWLAEITTPEFVTAWVPVIAALSSGVILFAIAYVLTDDIRVGLATVLMFALIPLQFVFSGIGYIEHRPYQYVWLGVALLGVVWIGVGAKHQHQQAGQLSGQYLRATHIWAASIATGIAIVILVYVWRGSPLLIAPLLGYILLRVPMDLSVDVSPIRSAVPLVVSLAIGSSLSFLIYSQLNWGSIDQPFVPAYILFILLITLIIAEVWRLSGFPAFAFFPTEVAIVAVSSWSIITFRPDIVDQVVAELGTSIEAVLDRSSNPLTSNDTANIADTVSTFEPGIVIGPLQRLGLAFFVAVPVLLWITFAVIRSYEPGWLVIVVYSWSMLIAAAVMTRFAGQLSMLISVLAGFGLIMSLAYADIVRPVSTAPAPAGVLPRAISKRVNRLTDNTDSVSQSQRITRLRGLTTRREYLKIGSSFVVAGLPGAALGVGTTIESNYDDLEIKAMQAIVTHQRTVSREYPQNFVLSRWGTNRMYNYFTNGEASSYSFARSNYADFLTTETPDQWAQDHMNRVGYVAIDADDVELPAGTAYHMLQRRLGVAMSYRDPLQHYRLIYLAAEDDTPDDWRFSVFAVVPGATITGTGTPGETVVAGTEIAISGITFPYRQSVTIDDDGQFTLRLPYPGRYDVQSTTVQISEADIIENNTISI